MKALLAALPILLAARCGGTPGAALHAPTQSEWTEARGRLAELRSGRVSAYVEEIRIAIQEPRSKRVLLARGALAVRPGDAMRMILLGPGGTTALDAWVTHARWRLVVPPLELERRGETNPPPEQGLPIGFFRWWFLAPFEGRLLDASVSREGAMFVLRDGAATVTLFETRAEQNESVVAWRREHDIAERIDWVRGEMGVRAGGPRVGDHARYVHVPSGFVVEVVVDAVASNEPDPAAFLDPDDPGVAL
jgi:hypothetical protein